MASRHERHEDRRRSRSSDEPRRKGVHPKEGSGRNNFGQEHRGAKSPFAGPSPMETAAQGERWGNRPKGPSLRASAQNQSGGGKPRDTVDAADRKDVAAHTGRDCASAGATVAGIAWDVARQSLLAGYEAYQGSGPAAVCPWRGRGDKRIGLWTAGKDAARKRTPREKAWGAFRAREMAVM